MVTDENTPLCPAPQPTQQVLSTSSAFSYPDQSLISRYLPCLQQTTASPVSTVAATTTAYFPNEQRVSNPAVTASAHYITMNPQPTYPAVTASANYPTINPQPTSLTLPASQQAADFLSPRKLFHMCELKRTGLLQGRNAGTDRLESPYLFHTQQTIKMQRLLLLDRHREDMAYCRLKVIHGQLQESINRLLILLPENEADFVRNDRTKISLNSLLMQLKLPPG